MPKSQTRYRFWYSGEMRRLGLGLLALLVAPEVWAGRAANPSEAMVFIRVIGEVRAEYQETWEKSVERRDVEIGTGSGFVISPYGHVLTNYHVISGAKFSRNVQGTEVRVSVEIDQVEVVFPSGDGGDGSLRRFVASVDAVDPELDLAVLSIPGGDLPYIAFGDSDAIGSSEPVEVLGFPFGREVEVGRMRLPDIIPEVSKSRGTVAAVRVDETGQPRYVQTNATMNPGNSGGPVVDQEGYALGVTRMKLADGEGIGFAVAINRVKDFLEAHGLDSLLDARRLWLGPHQILDGKGLGVRFPDGIEDVSPQRLRVDSADALEGLSFRVDRVASPWGVDQLQGLLVSGEAFESFRPTQKMRPFTAAGSKPAVLGEVTGSVPGEAEPMKMMFALVDLGDEKLVARYVGRADLVAFNRAVLQDSLASLEAERLLVDEVRGPLRPNLEDVALPLPKAPRVRMPSAGWTQEVGAPFPCQDLTPVDSALATSPAGDFTIALRAGWRQADSRSSVEAASACSARRGSFGPSSYTFRIDWLGISYAVEGVFVTREDGLLQLEAVSPIDKQPFLRELFTAWIEENSH